MGPIRLIGPIGAQTIEDEDDDEDENEVSAALGSPTRTHSGLRYLNIH